MDAEACRGLKKVSHSLELKLQAVLSCLAWVLGTRFPAKAAHGAVTEPSFQTLYLHFYVYCRAIYKSQFMNQARCLLTDVERRMVYA